MILESQAEIDTLGETYPELADALKAAMVVGALKDADDYVRERADQLLLECLEDLENTFFVEDEEEISIEDEIAEEDFLDDEEFFSEDMPRFADSGGFIDNEDGPAQLELFDLNDLTPHK